MPNLNVLPCSLSKVRRRVGVAKPKIDGSFCFIREIKDGTDKEGKTSMKVINLML